LKLMAAVAQPSSHLMACDIVPGNAADDPLYLPLIRRVRQQLHQKGLLYCGDSKMAALATRAEGRCPIFNSQVGRTFTFLEPDFRIFCKLAQLVRPRVDTMTAWTTSRNLNRMSA